MGRSILYTFWILLLALNGVSQINYVFNNRNDLNSNKPDAGVKVAYWNKGILTVGGSFDSTGMKQTISVSFSDTLGNIQWSKTYWNNYYQMSCSELIILNNSSFYVAGTAYHDSTTSYDALFAKFDTNGDSVYFRFYVDPTPNWFIDAEKLSGDTIVLLGAWKANDTAMYAKITLFKFDTLGNVLSSITRPSDLKYPQQLVIDSANHTLYVGGTRRTSTSSTNWTLFWFLQKFNYQLQYQTTISYQNTNGPEYYMGLNIWNGIPYLTWLIPLQPNPNYFQTVTYQLGSFLYYYGPINYTNWIINWEPKVINSRWMAVPICNEVVGYLYNDIYLIDSSLTHTCYLNILYDTSAVQEIDAITILPNNKIAGTGYLFADSTHSEDHWNFMTENALDWINSNCLSSVPSHLSNSIYLVYPTLFDDQLIVEIKENYLAPSSVKITNSLGQVIKELKFQQYVSIDTREYPSGVYYLQFSSFNDSKTFKVIKGQ